MKCLVLSTSSTNLSFDIRSGESYAFSIGPGVWVLYCNRAYIDNNIVEGYSEGIRNLFLRLYIWPPSTTIMNLKFNPNAHDS